MTEQSIEETVKEEKKYQTLAEFLESTPPNQLINISDLSVPALLIGENQIREPEIQLHCNNKACNGIRFFRCISGGNTTLVAQGFTYFYLTYRCSNCQKFSKTFSIAARLNSKDMSQGECFKFGELPPYGPPVSPKLINLIGPDRDEFLRGTRCENQGLGVGAFIYYRRVVENQRNRIIGEIIKVSEKIRAPEAELEKLRNALIENQFTKSLEMAKDAIPESLLIDGHSPILLLHNALSKGLHTLTDEQCLELAHSVRIVLGELSERISQALKDEAELKKALSTLMHKKND